MPYYSYSMNLFVKTSSSILRKINRSKCILKGRICRFSSATEAIMSKLTHIPEIEKLSGRVTRVLGCNPGIMTLQGTNCHLVGTGKRRILIDTGEANNEKFVANLERALREAGCEIQEVIITHWHPDHTGGIKGVVQCLDKNARISKFPRVKGIDDSLEGGLHYSYVEDNHIFQTEGATLRAVYTPGHTDDHMSLWLEEEGATFSGDTVLGEGTAHFEDLHDYMQSLDKILALKSLRIYPSHGALILNPEEHITMYINHRNQRERQIVKALSEAQAAMSPEDVVRVVYVGLSESLIRAASDNVSHHLHKLVKEGKVVALEDGSYQVNKSSL